MKLFNFLLSGVILSILFIASACSNNNPVVPIATACNGMNLCFKMNGTQYNMNAEWRTPPSRNRVYWEEGSGANYKNVELDIYGTTTGAYSIDTSSTATNRATFQYFINESGTIRNIQGLSGTVNFTEMTATTISGNFIISAQDASGTTYEITEGSFINVPKP